MGRIEGWEGRLAATVGSWQAVSFVWGKSDCLHFCMACERALCGESRLDGFPKYKTEGGGFRAMKKRGFAAIPDLIDATYERKALLLAQRGDWVMIEQDIGPAFGVVTGRRVAAMSESGLIFYPVGEGVLAWWV